MRTDCCGANYYEGTEHQMAGKWWGRCQRCKEMAELIEEEDDEPDQG